MQTWVLKLLPEEQTLQIVSWGIDCIPAESREVGNLATDFIAGRTLLPWGLLKATHANVAELRWDQVLGSQPENNRQEYGWRV